MKRIITLLLCAVMLISLCACAKNKEQKPVTSYDELITKLSETVTGMFSEDFEKKLKEGAYPSPTGELPEKWMTTLSEAKMDFRNVDENAFGYKLVDINSDGRSELFFMRSDDRILAIFTLNAEGKPCMVDCYGRTYRGVIRDTGDIYTLTVRDDGGYDYEIYTLNAVNGGMISTVKFGSQGYIAYERMTDGTYTTTTERLTELTEEYPFEMSEAFTNFEFILF